MRVFSLKKSFKRNALTSGLMITMMGCSSAVDQLNIEIEPALAVLGGAILSTQNSGLIAMAAPKPNAILKIQNFLNPLPEAFAACPAVTLGSCLDDTGINTPGSNTNLQIFYNNCQSTTMDSPGYWRTYHVLSFQSEAACTAVQGAGFTGAGLTAAIGQTVTKTFGSLADDQNNIRLATIVDDRTEAVYLYSKYDSGWQVSKSGGVEISFIDATTRSINIKGVHAVSMKYESVPINTQSFDLLALAAGISVSWDHTINTVKTGDELFGIGPQVVQTGGTVAFGDQLTAPVATFDGDITVSGSTVQKGAVIRIQQNVSQSVAVAIVTKDLVYDDPTCCWPSSGTVISKFDLNYPAPTAEDSIEFLNTSCGAIRYTTAEGQSARDTLRHCF